MLRLLLECNNPGRCLDTWVIMCITRTATANTKLAESCSTALAYSCALQAATCADVRPVSKPGVKYECLVHTEFVPEEAKTFPPTQSACCKVGPAAAL